MNRLRLILPCLFFLFLSIKAAAQTPAITSGRHFIVAFPDTLVASLPNKSSGTPPADQALIVLFSDDTANVTVTGVGYRRVVTVLPSSSTTLSLHEPFDPAPEPIVNDVWEVSKNTFDVISDRDIIVYCYFITANGAEAFTPIPVESWGTEYFSMNLTPDSLYAIRYLTNADQKTEELFDGGLIAPAQILVIAAENDTKITIAGQGANGPVQRDVDLDAGEAYLEEGEILSARIAADKPIGVISGNTRNNGRDMLRNGVMLPTGTSLANSGVEWLWPTKRLGTEFVYTRPDPFDIKSSGAVLRIYATTPGLTRVTTSLGDSYDITFGQFVELVSTKDGGTTGQTFPVTFTATQPVQACVVSGPWARYQPSPLNGRETWAQAMASLVSHENWGTRARFHAPMHPPYLKHSVTIIADLGAKVWLDGAAVRFDTVPKASYVHARMDIAAGDHLITSAGGRFSAIAYGSAYGLEEYSPVGAKGEQTPRPLHESVYSEQLAVAYAYPIAGRAVSRTDYQEYCDHSDVYLYDLDTLNDATFRVTIDDGAVNTSVSIISFAGTRAGLTSFRIRFSPVDGSIDASAHITVVSRGEQWEIPYVRRSGSLTVDPKQVHLTGVPIGIDRAFTVSVENRRAFPLPLRRVRLLHGDTGTGGGFALTGGAPPSLLDSGTVYGVSLTFRGVDSIYAYTDSLIIETGCDTIVVPLFARTAAIEYRYGCTETEAIVSDLDTLLYAPFTIQADTVGRNADLEITTMTVEGSSSLELHIVFRPRDLSRDASATVRITGNGKTWDVRYTYSARSVVFDPDPLLLWDVSPEITVGTPMTLRSLKRFPLKIVRIGLVHGPTNGEGFTLGDLPRLDRLEPGTTYPFSIGFYGTEYGRVYTDSLMIVTECDTEYVLLRAQIQDEPRVPTISNYDWREQWIVAANRCTRNGIGVYAATVEVANPDDVAHTVESVELIGPDADAGYFALDLSDPARTISAGTVLLPHTQIGSKRYLQKVLFRPDAEREYTCTVRLLTREGDTAIGLLRGVGVETHLSIDGLDFGKRNFISGMTIPGVVMLRALPTRPLTVTGLRIVGSNSTDFRFTADFLDTLPSFSSPWKLKPGDSVPLRLEFAPAHPGMSTAAIVVDGDYSLCDDSLGALIGRTEGLDLRGYDFGVISGCIDSTGEIRIRNDGADSVSIMEIRSTDSAGVFELGLPTFPYVLAPGEESSVSVRFSPGVAGSFTSTVTVTIQDIERSDSIREYSAELTGAAVTTTIRAHIDRAFSAAPGKSVQIPIVLDEPLDLVAGEELTVTIGYNPGLMRLYRVSTEQTVVEGWDTAVVENVPGSYTVRLISPGGGTTGGGMLLNLRFVLYLADTSSSELPFTIDIPGRRCVVSDLSPGLARVDSVCGLSLRLIEIGTENFALLGNRPNPFNPETEISFSIGLDGYTTLIVYDAEGREVERLLQSHLDAGRYTVRWNAGNYPSGLYFYRLTSGDWSRSGRMVLVK